MFLSSGCCRIEVTNLHGDYTKSSMEATYKSLGSCNSVRELGFRNVIISITIGLGLYREPVECNVNSTRRALPFGISLEFNQDSLFCIHFVYGLV